MTWTKDQLKAMQDAGVPLQWNSANIGRPEEWHDGADLSDSPCFYLPKPGCLFSGSIPMKLLCAGIPIERKTDCGWIRAYGADKDSSWTYRIMDSCDSSEPIANEAGRPICLADEIANLDSEIDELHGLQARLQEDLRITQKAYVSVVAERAEALRERDALKAQVTDLKARLDAIREEAAC